MVFENDDLFPDNPSENIQAYLELLCNKFGDFQVHSFYRKDGQVKINPAPDGSYGRHTVLELHHPHFFLNEKKIKDYFQSINQRSILPCEIVFDYENKEDAVLTADLFRKFGINFLVFDTQSKGLHIHLYFPEMLNWSKERREEMRTFFFHNKNLPFSDLCKKSEGTMIALEYARHWKSNFHKKLISKRGNGLNYFPK